MSKILESLDSKKAKDIRVMRNFIAIFCRENHGERTRDAFATKDVRLYKVLGNKELLLCDDCRKLFSHGVAKLLLCPYDPKPMCKKCTTHCYAPGYRERIRQVMRFSGWYMIKHGRVDLLLHYLF